MNTVASPAASPTAKSAFSSLVRLLAALSLFTILSALAACSGGGGTDDEDDNGNPPPSSGTLVIFDGSVSDGSVDTKSAVDGVTVCALGSCDVTDASGRYSFTVPTESFGGGSVVFSFIGNGVNSSTTVENLSSEATAITISFFVEDNGSITTDEVEQDTPAEPEPTPDPEDEAALPTDPQDRACEILRRANISIPNHEGTVAIGATSDCPQEIEDIVVVGNIHNIPYTYALSSDAPDALAFDPESGSVTGTQLNKHNGSYLCTRSADFTAIVTATITEYQPNDGLGPITPAEAIDLCGRNASVGNTSETVSVIFDLP